MRFLAAICALLPMASATAEPLTSPATSAQRSGVRIAPEGLCPTPLFHRKSPSPRPERKNLTDLPLADAYHAVYRLDANGCVDPVMVGYQYGRKR